LVLIADSHFRTVTVRLIIENFTKFICAFVEKKSKQSSESFETLNTIYYSYLSKVKLMMINNQFLKETAYELFTSEWKEYSKDFDLLVSELVSYPFLLVPPNLIDEIEGKELI